MNMKLIEENMSEEDKKVIYEILDKYKTDKVFNLAIPDWLYDRERNNLHKITYSMVENIVHANEIYVVNQSEYDLRRKYCVNKLNEI